MDVLPADTAALAQGAIAGDAVAGLFEAAEPLDVQVDQLAGMLALVADHRRGRLQVPDPVQAGGPQDPAHRGRRDPDLAGDLLAGEPLAAKGDNPRRRLGRRRAMELVRPRGAIHQPRWPFRLEASHPLADGLGVDAEGRSNRLRRLPLAQHPTHQLGSTVRCQPGILMHVHPALS